MRKEWKVIIAFRINKTHAKKKIGHRSNRSVFRWNNQRIRNPIEKAKEDFYLK